MTAHDHRVYVPGCHRCELGRDEYEDALVDEVEELRQALGDLLGVAEDMRPYVPEYIAVKWEHDEGLERARRALNQKEERMIEYRICWSASSNIAFHGATDWEEWGDEGDPEEVLMECEDGSRQYNAPPGLDIALEASGFEWYVETRASDKEDHHG